MTNLSDFGAGALPEKQDDDIAHDTRSDRARHRRKTYRLGRCRAVSKSKGCRCGGAVIDDTDGALCHYHGMEQDAPASQLVTIDDDACLLARWCGSRPTTFEELPEACRAALEVYQDDSN
jgi:hypothetical protein